jgi:transcriptional regulator with XRE-family HTH domain
MASQTIADRIAQLQQRIACLRLPKKQLAALAGTDEDTVHRTLGGKTMPLASTLFKLERALDVEEAKVRRHLLGHDLEGAGI